MDKLYEYCIVQECVFVVVVVVVDNDEECDSTTVAVTFPNFLDSLLLICVPMQNGYSVVGLPLLANRR